MRHVWKLGIFFLKLFFGPDDNDEDVFWEMNCSVFPRLEHLTGRRATVPGLASPTQST